MARPKTQPGDVRLSPSEWQMMRICWRLGRANVRQIHGEDQKRRDRDYRTILTFVSRMAAKGFLKVEKQGNVNYYTPAVTRLRELRRETERFLEEVVGSERDGLELVEKAVARRLAKKAKKPRSSG